MGFGFVLFENVFFVFENYVLFLRITSFFLARVQAGSNNEIGRVGVSQRREWERLLASCDRPLGNRRRSLLGWTGGAGGGAYATQEAALGSGCFLFTVLCVLDVYMRVCS